MKYTRDELLCFKTKFVEKPIHFDNIHKIFKCDTQNTIYWKPNSVITSEYDKIKKNSFNILNKLSLDNFSKLSKSLVLLLQKTNKQMIQLFITEMINKCAYEKTYNHLYVELYDVLKNEILYFHEYFLETLQSLYESPNGDKIYKLGLLFLIMNLYKKGILTEYIIHHCLKQMFEKKMFEEICILFTECGKYLDHSLAKEYNKKTYFDCLINESHNKENGMRICFKIQDLLDLYKKNWSRT